MSDEAENSAKAEATTTMSTSIESTANAIPRFIEACKYNAFPNYGQYNFGRFLNEIKDRIDTRISLNRKALPGFRAN